MSITVTAAEHVAYLAGLSGDGTSNGSLAHLANKCLAAVTVCVVVIFGIKTIFAMSGGKAKGDGRFVAGGGRGGWSTTEAYKNLVDAAAGFMITEGIVFAAWALVRLGAAVATGATG